MLKQKDAPYMLEWMHDVEVVKDLHTNFLEKKIIDCEKFIEQAQKKEEYVHMAIVDDADTYMGTVSLKHITAKDAEFAITVRKCAMGKGYSKYGMEKIMEIGFKELGLKQIYWCVDEINIRAVRFYEKNHYEHLNLEQEKDLMNRIIEQGEYTKEQIRKYRWYVKKVE